MKILTERMFQKKVAEAIKEDNRGIYYLMTFYSANPILLQEALDAFHKVPLGHVSKSYEGEQLEILIAPMGDAIRAFAAGMQRIREGDNDTGNQIDIQKNPHRNRWVP